MQHGAWYRNNLLSRRRKGSGVENEYCPAFQRDMITKIKTNKQKNKQRANSLENMENKTYKLIGL